MDQNSSLKHKYSKTTQPTVNLHKNLTTKLTFSRVKSRFSKKNYTKKMNLYKNSVQNRLYFAINIKIKWQK